MNSMTVPDTSMPVDTNPSPPAGSGTSRRPVTLAISLKMYLDPEQTRQWCTEVADLATSHVALTAGVARLIVLPSIPTVEATVKVFTGTSVSVGAQDLFHQDRGPFTGAVSGADLAMLGCRYVEVGHLERRRLFGDDEPVVTMKMQAAWRNGLIPLLCVGEPHDTSATEAARYSTAQVASALGKCDSAASGPLVVAYEPGWAIGAAQPAGPAHVQVVVDALRKFLTDLGMSQTPIIYGGSAGRGTLGSLGNAVDGLFLGRFAHDVQALRSVLDETVSRVDETVRLQ
jgi:triosephosphate isomerase